MLGQMYLCWFECICVGPSAFVLAHWFNWFKKLFKCISFSPIVLMSPVYLYWSNCICVGLSLFVLVQLYLCWFECICVFLYSCILELFSYYVHSCTFWLWKMMQNICILLHICIQYPMVYV